jgi:CelD/BcsL family acetyltransferase involved in cellulose biosynthesis
VALRRITRIIAEWRMAMHIFFACIFWPNPCFKRNDKENLIRSLGKIGGAMEPKKSMLRLNKSENRAPNAGEGNSTSPGLVDRKGADKLELASIALSDDLRSLEAEWRSFECYADCTPFQSFDWLSNWQDCVGEISHIKPIIVTGRSSSGKLLFLLPLTIEKNGFLRRLVFLGRELCDYNAPLLAPEFSDIVSPSQFIAKWHGTCAELFRAGNYKYDFVFFDKMPERVGQQTNPMLTLATTKHASGAHATELTEDWDQFYAAKRSASTRRRDRTKYRRLAAHGDVQFVTPQNKLELKGTLHALIDQKSKAFSRMGVSNLFERPGHSEFFIALANNASSFAHVSYIAVGSIPAATNLGLHFRDRYYHVLASYREGATANFGPGALHLREMMRYAISLRCKQFDFTIGDESYKRDWADSQLDLYDHISSITWSGWIAVKLLTLRLCAKRYIKHSPMLWKCVGVFRNLVSRMTRQKNTPPAAQSEK